MDYVFFLKCLLSKSSCLKKHILSNYLKTHNFYSDLFSVIRNKKLDRFLKHYILKETINVKKSLEMT